MKQKGQQTSWPFSFLMACLAAVLVIWNMIFGCLEAINIIGVTNRVEIVVSGVRGAMEQPTALARVGQQRGWPRERSGYKQRSACASFA